MLHWVKEADQAAAAMSRALKAGRARGGGVRREGNTQALLDAVFAAQQELGGEPSHPWYYPSVGEYASVMERHGLEVRFATCSTGRSRWRRRKGFGGVAGDVRQTFFKLPSIRERKQDFVRLVEERARPKLYRDGGWTMDYRRLRVMAARV